MLDVMDSFFEVSDDNAQSFTPQTRELDFREFVQMVLQLRGSNTLTVKDLIVSRRQITKSMSQICETLHSKLHTDIKSTYCSGSALDASCATLSTSFKPAALNGTACVAVEAMAQVEEALAAAQSAFSKITKVPGPCTTDSGRCSLAPVTE